MEHEPVPGAAYLPDGAVQGKGVDGEHLEASMPENVKALPEPCRRHTI
jgi:hypothetical protein